MDTTSFGAPATRIDINPDVESVGGWAIVPDHCTAAFAVRNFGVHMVHGVVPVLDGTVAISVDGDGVGLSAVRMTLDLAAIDTANRRRDKDLRSPHLLDTEHHPELVFDCTDVRAVSGGWRLNGTLAAHGHTTPVMVDAVLVSGPIRDHITVRGTTSFDRRSLGIRVPSFMIGQKVAVEVSAQFRRQFLPAPGGPGEIPASPAWRRRPTPGRR